MPFPIDVAFVGSHTVGMPIQAPITQVRYNVQLRFEAFMTEPEQILQIAAKASFQWSTRM
jgi:hypothetical protein